MPTASRSVPEDIQGAIVRILAYMGALAMLAVAAAGLFRAPAVVAAVGPAPPRPQWTEIERPYPVFDLTLPKLGKPSRYAILRRGADDARKDVLTWGAANAGGPYVMVEVYRPGRARERFIDAASEIAARIADFTVVSDVKPTGVIDGKFGVVPLVDFAIAEGTTQRRCLGFARAFANPLMQVAGWYCSAGAEAVARTELACAIDRLTLISAGGDERLAELFAHAELKRTFCGERDPLLAATPEGRTRAAAKPRRGASRPTAKPHLRLGERRGRKHSSFE